MKLISFLLGIRRELKQLHKMQKQYDADVRALRDEVFQLRLYFRSLGYNPSPQELNAFGRKPI